MNKEKIALWCVRILGIIAVAVLVLFFSGACPQWFTGRGDLYRLSSIKKYREDVAAPYHADESVHTAPLDSAVVWWLGDSFSRVQFGHKPLPEEVGEELSAAGLGKISAIDYVDLQGSPKSLIALAQAHAATGRNVPKVIVVETVERNVVNNFGKDAPFDYGNVAPWNEGRGVGSVVKKFRRRAFLEAPGAVDFKLRRFPPTAAISEVLDTWRYDMFDDEHPNVYAGNGILDFADDSIHGWFAARGEKKFYVISPDEIPSVVGTLSSLDSLAKTFGSKLLFVMPPNRTFMFMYGNRYMYGMEDLNSDSVRYVFYDALDSARVNYVNLYKPFVKAIAADSTLELYWKTDTHWNGNAHRIAAKVIVKKLKELLN